MNSFVDGAQTKKNPVSDTVFTIIWRRSLIVFLVVVISCYLGWRSFFTINFQHPILAALFLLADWVAGLSTIGFALSIWQLDSPVDFVPPSMGLKVDVWIPTYNESIEILTRTIYHCVNMEYPHQTYVLDDGNRPEVRDLAARLGAHYITREQNTHAKAGNLNNALKHTNGDFIAIFDADFIPQSDFLMKLLGYFTNPRIAFVQTPQCYYNLSSFQHSFHERVGKNKLSGHQAIRHEQQTFFDQILPGRNHWNAAFWIGTNAILRREAIESIGGFATDSVIEDMLTSMKIHARKWRSLYVNLPLAYGLAPSNIAQFLTQRLRWSKGAAQIMRKYNPVFFKGLSMMQRFCYFSSLLHFFEGAARLLFYFLPALYILTGISAIHANPITITILMGYIITNFSVLYLISHGKISLIDNEIHSVIRFLTYLKGNLSFFVKRSIRFVVTPKDDNAKKSAHFLLGPLMVFGVNIAAIVSKIYLVQYRQNISIPFVFCLLLCGYYVLVSFGAIRLVFSKTPTRSSDIFDQNFLEISTNNTPNETAICLVKAWNEQSARILSSYPFLADSEIRLKIETDTHEFPTLKAHFSNTLKHTNNKIHEFEVVFTDLPQAEQLHLIDYIFQNGVKRQYLHLQDSAGLKFSPLVVWDPPQTVTIGGILNRGHLIVKYHKTLPENTILQITLPKYGNFSFTVSGSMILGDRIYLLGSLDHPLPWWYRLKTIPVFKPVRSWQVIKISLVTIGLIFAAIGFNSLISLRSFLADSDYLFAFTPPKPPSSHVVKKYGHLQVIGRQLCSETGQPIQLRGISSHGLQWYPFVKGNTVRNSVKFFKIEVIRIAMYVEDFKNGEYWSGYLAQPDYMLAKTNMIIRDAIDEGIYVIISWHIHNDPQKYTRQAEDFFRYMSKKWGAYPNLIFEICNEPEGNIPWSKIRNYAVGHSQTQEDGIIGIIRQNDPDSDPNLIIVGTPFWSQQVDKVLEAPITEYGNIMYTLHFYASEHKQDIRQRAQQALDQGLPIFVSEWGTCDYKNNRPNDFDSSLEWLRWMDANHISWVNWSLSPKQEPSSLLKPGSSIAGPWSDRNLTKSGRFIKELLSK